MRDGTTARRASSTNNVFHTPHRAQLDARKMHPPPPLNFRTECLANTGTVRLSNDIKGFEGSVGLLRRGRGLGTWYVITVSLSRVLSFSKIRFKIHSVPHRQPIMNCWSFNVTTILPFFHHSRPWNPVTHRRAGERTPVFQRYHQ
jgi:hypothetical protein